jgi:hypothetical protein
MPSLHNILRIIQRLLPSCLALSGKFWGRHSPLISGMPYIEISSALVQSGIHAEIELFTYSKY